MSSTSGKQEIAAISPEGCVLHVLDHSWPLLSGYSIRSRNLLKAQNNSGQSVMALTGPLHELEDRKSEDLVVDGVWYRRTRIAGRLAGPALRGEWTMLRELEVVRLLYRSILRVIDNYPVRLVYAHSPALCGLAALKASRARGLPFVYEVRAFWEDAAVDQLRVTEGSLKYRLTRGLETYVCRRADAVSAIAKPMLADLRERGIDSDRLFHVPNGVDAERLRAIPRDETLARQLQLGDAPVLGFFGSLYRYEGVAWLIRAAADLRSRGSRFVLLIVGKGEEQEAIRKTINDLRATEWVRFLDAVPHEAIRSYYSIADIMVFPRVSARVTELVTPLKPLEAMALEKPVLASSVGGHRELIQDEVTGLLFKPGSIDHFCDQADRLISSASLRDKLGNQGRAMVLQEKSWDLLATRYQQIYEFVLGVGERSGQALAAPVLGG